MGKTIYAVSCGEYSDYCVDRLFTNKKDAENYAHNKNAQAQWYDEYFVEEFNLYDSYDKDRVDTHNYISVTALIRNHCVNVTHIGKYENKSMETDTRFEMLTDDLKWYSLPSEAKAGDIEVTIVREWKDLDNIDETKIVKIIADEYRKWRLIKENEELLKIKERLE